MLAKYTPPVLSKNIFYGPPKYRPQTLADLLAMSTDLPTCKMAIAAEDIDKTMTMYDFVSAISLP